MFRRVFLIAHISIAFAATAAAENVSICRQLTQVINHPAQYAAEKIQQCTSGGGLDSLLGAVVTPQCCLPGWELNPSCYIMKEVLKKDAWTETHTELSCNAIDIKKGINEFASWYLDPKMVALQPAKGLFDLFEASRALLLSTSAEKLPNDVSDYLKSKFVGKPGIPFTASDIDSARWKPYTDAGTKPFLPSTWGFEHDSITYGNVIIAGPGLLAATSCLRMSKWAHELTHLHQYETKGQDKFLADYISEAKIRGVPYDELSTELEAKSVEQFVYSSCPPPIGSSSAASPSIFDGSVEKITFTNLDGSSGIITRYGSDWKELSNGKEVFNFREIERDKDTILLLDKSRNMYLSVPVTSGTSRWKRIDEASWHPYVNMNRSRK